MSKKLLAIFGATGNQGTSIITTILNSTSLSNQYKIRAITRNISSPKSQTLSSQNKNIEVVEADFTSPISISSALTHVHTIFLMSTPSSGPNAAEEEEEFNTIKSTIDIAVAQGMQYIIFSTLPHVSRSSGGEFTRVTPFDAKAKAEAYIRSVPVQSAFYCPGSFMQNFLDPAAVGIRRSEDGGKWVMERHVSGETRLPLIDAVGDTGKFVAAILAKPERFAGKVVRAAVREYSLEEIVGCLSRATGEEIVYRQVPLRGDVGEMAGWEALVVEYFGYLEKFGYFGPGQEEEVEWSVANARGKLSTFEEYLEVQPVKLE